MSVESQSPAPGASAAIPLGTEPVVFFHPTLAGGAFPGDVQPVPGTLLLEEEPAVWPRFDQ